MSLFDDCTPTLTPIPRKICAFNIGQVAKLAFWDASKPSPFTSTTILTAAGWTAAVTDDDNPVIVSNRLNNFVIPNSERVETAADTNANAMPELLRGGNVMASGNIRSVSPAEYAAYLSLIPFSQVDVGESNLAFAMINSANEIIFNPTAASLGFDAYALFIGSPSAVAELGGNSLAAINFMMLSDWFKGAQKGQIAFDFLRTYPLAA